MTATDVEEPRSTPTQQEQQSSTERTTEDVYWWLGWEV